MNSDGFRRRQVPIQKSRSQVKKTREAVMAKDSRDAVGGREPFPSQPRRSAPKPPGVRARPTQAAGLR